jgi:hypothetical protein
MAKKFDFAKGSLVYDISRPWCIGRVTAVLKTRLAITWVAGFESNYGEGRTVRYDLAHARAFLRSSLV